MTFRVCWWQLICILLCPTSTIACNWAIVSRYVCPLFLFLSLFLSFFLSFFLFPSCVQLDQLDLFDPSIQYANRWPTLQLSLPCVSVSCTASPAFNHVPEHFPLGKLINFTSYSVVAVVVPVVAAVVAAAFERHFIGRFVRVEMDPF